MKKDDFEHPTLQIVDHGHSLDKEFMFDTEGKKDDISTTSTVHTRNPESLPQVTTKAPKNLSSMQFTHTNKTKYFPSIEFKCSILESYTEVLGDCSPSHGFSGYDNISNLLPQTFIYVNDI